MASADQDRAFESAQENEELNQVEDMNLGSAVDESDLEPEDTTPARPMNNSLKPSRAGLYVGLSALVLALAGVGVGGFAMTQSESLRSDVAIAFEDVDANIASLGTSQTESSVEINKLREVIIDHDASISSFDTSRISQDVIQLRTAMAIYNEEMEASQQESQRVIDELKAELAALKNEMGELATRSNATANTQATTAAAPRPAAPKPRAIPTQNTLEGAEIVAVDQWGYEPHVILRNPAGEYMTVAEGEELMGWRYVSVDQAKGTVKFMKASRVIFVKVRT